MWWGFEGKGSLIAKLWQECGARAHSHTRTHAHIFSIVSDTQVGTDAPIIQAPFNVIKHSSAMHSLICLFRSELAG